MLDWFFVFWALPWWAIVLTLIYTVVIVINAGFTYSELDRYGLIYGFRKSICNGDTHFRLYHLFLMVILWPAVVLAFFFLILKKIFSFRLYEFKSAKKEREMTEQFRKSDEEQKAKGNQVKA